MPGIAAGILISTYLPGLVIASIWYLEEIICVVDCGDINVFMKQVNKVSTLSNFYFLGAVALAFGLFIDAVKHFFEWIITCCGYTVLGELTKKEFKAIEGDGAHQATINYALQRHSLLYHTYEFFSNMAVAMFFAAFMYYLLNFYRPFFFPFGPGLGAIILLVFAIVSFLFGLLYSGKANDLIGRPKINDPRRLRRGSFILAFISRVRREVKFRWM